MRYMVKRIGFSWLLLGLLLCSCDKTIEIDYKDAVPRYAIEGWLTPFETIVHVCQTRSMSDTLNVSDISNAVVTVTDDDGHVEKIPFSPNLHGSAKIVLERTSLLAKLFYKIKRRVL